MVAHRGLLFLLSPRESLLLGFSVLYHTISSCCHHAKAVFLAVLFVYLFVFARSTMSLNHESHLNVCFLFSPREPCFLLFSLQVRMGARVDAAAPAFLKKYLTAKRAVEKRLQEVGKTLRSPPLFPPPPPSPNSSRSISPRSERGGEAAAQGGNPMRPFLIREWTPPYFNPPPRWTRPSVQY